MSEQTRKEMLVSEEFFKTPDMGEYLSNDLLVQAAESLVNGQQDAEYFLEAPFSEVLGYHQAENVFVISGDPIFKGAYLDNKFDSTANYYDGDTISIRFENIEDGGQEFTSSVDGQTYSSPKAYFMKTMSLQGINNPEALKVRVLGINAPELPHMMWVPIGEKPQIVKVKLKDVTSKTYVDINLNGKIMQVPTSQFSYVKYKLSYDETTGKDNVAGLRDMNSEELIPFALVYNEKDNGNTGMFFYELLIRSVDDQGNETYYTKNFFPGSSDGAATYYRACVVSAGPVNDLEYHKQAIESRDEIIDLLSKATEIRYIIDNTVLEKKKGVIPEAYKKPWEREDSLNPFNAFRSYLHEMVTSGNTTFTRMGYSYFGQDTNGRSLGAIYAKVPTIYGGQWINVAKYLAFKYNSFKKNPQYNSSPDEYSEYGYNSNAFKLWTYDNTKQYYLDKFANANEVGKGDDRAEVQKLITGIDINEASNHTVMIGDVFLMIPPTSIRYVSQTNTSRASMLRAKGSIMKSLPKAERIIEMNLFFNGEDQINGIKFEQETPSGQKMIYYMNGLRALIAQFKFTPYLPILNEYINNVLGIDAVALVSYEINTMPNYPRTLQVTLRLKDFDWQQYMPEILPPDAEEGQDIYTNLFAQTIHFPVMRYYYQRALMNGEELIGYDFNSPEYIESTIGQKTCLQPIGFDNNTLKLYIPNEEHLKAKKQLKLQLEKNPLETVYTFTEKEKQLLNEIAKMWSAISLRMKSAKKWIDNNIVPLEDAKWMFNANILDTPGAEIGNYYILDSSITSSGKERTWGVFQGKPLRLGQASIIKTRTQVYDEYFLKIAGELQNIQKDNNLFDTSIIENVQPTQWVQFNNAGSSCQATVNWGVKIRIDWSKTGISGTEEKVIKYMIKELNCTKEQLVFSSDTSGNHYIRIGLSAAFLGDNRAAMPLNRYFEYETGYGYEMLRRIASSFSNGEGEIVDDENMFNTSENLANMKDNIDLESASSLVFDEYEIGNPIITKMSSAYNNVFANMSMQCYDGYASQFTGGSDTAVEITMQTKDEVTVTRLQALSKICVHRMIEYRKVLTTSPLRIDSEFTRMLGINEVVIESIEVNTIPNMPGVFEISMRLISAERTLRNREALKKLNINNSKYSNSDIIKTKNYFEINNTLARVELYPDLELPTIEELERIGYYFIRYKRESARLFPDPDFYFVYLQLFTADMIRESIVEFFNDSNNFEITKELSGNLFKDKATAKLYLKDGEASKALEDKPEWKRSGNYMLYLPDASTTYNEDLQNLYSSIEDIMNTDARKIDEKTAKKVDKLADTISDRNSIILALQECLEATGFNTFDFNAVIKISISDSIPFSSEDAYLENGEIEAFNKDGKLVKEQTNNIVKTANKTVKQIIKDILSKPIDKDLDFSVFEDYFENSILNADSTKVDQKYRKYYNRKLFKKLLFKSAARGATAKYAVTDKTIDEKKASCEAMSHISKVNGQETIKAYVNGSTIEVGPNETYRLANVLFPIDGQGISDLALASTEEEFNKGVVFGKYGIKRYTPAVLQQIYGKAMTTASLGFADPYYNKDLSKIFLGQEISTEEYNARFKKYTEIITGDSELTDAAFYRVMLVWLYKFIDSETSPLIADSMFLLRDVGLLLEEAKEQNDWWGKDAAQWISKQWSKFNAWAYNNGDGSFAIFKDDEEKARQHQLKLEAKEAESETESTLNDKVKEMKSEIDNYKFALLNGLYVTLASVALTEFDSPITSCLLANNIGEYQSFIQRIKAAYLTCEGLSSAELKLRKFFMSLDEDLELKDPEYTANTSAFDAYSVNSKLQRIFLKCAEDPSIYMMHSFYDMVMNDKRGRMARAFPAYYMLLIDEGRELGVWKLQDNFYDVSSILEFQVVKSRKIAADTATISMTNFYGTFTTEDEDIKDEYQYTFKDAWNSIFSPRTYYTKEYNRRANAREFNRCNLKPGARVHLRAGYGSDASKLPILFNGTVAEVQQGDVITVICQGDGIEIANPNMFNPADKAKDIADLENQDKLFKRFLNAFNNKSTPRDILINPLIAKGSWIQEIIKDYTDGRLFNANPFGIVHFGDRNFKEIFTNNGEVEQNIYEAISKPSWHESVNNGTASLYSMESAPKIRVGISGNRSYWDLMHIAASVSPDFIPAIVPFQMRSSIFFGAPRYYYAYDYDQTYNGQIIEKRKPFQQYHVLTSYSDIIHNKITASATDVRTCAVGLYTGDGILSSDTKTVGPLYLDIDIYPEKQQMTTINCDFQSKLTDMPFTIPVIGYLMDKFSDKGGYQTAWRATAHGLQQTVKDMYTGDIAIIGNPIIKPYDKVMIFDNYEDMQGMIEVETVVHSFTVDGGFTTSITPDLISAIDDKYEQISTSTAKEVLLPALTAHAAIALSARKYKQVTRNLYFSASQTAKVGVDLGEKIVRNTANLIGDADMAKYQHIAKPLSDKIFSKLGIGFGVTEMDYNIYQGVNKITKAYTSIKNSYSLTSATALVEMLDDLQKLPEKIHKLNPNELKSMLKSSLESATKEADKQLIKEAISKLDGTDGYISSYNTILKEAEDLIKIDKDIVDDIVTKVNKIFSAEGKEMPEAVKESIDYLKKLDSKGIKYGVSNFDDALNHLKTVAYHADDISDVTSINKIKNVFSETKSLISAKGFDNIGDAFKGVNSIIKGGTKLAASIGPQILWLAAEIILTKTTQEFIERKLKNLQVLTLFPVMKNNKVLVAGIDGHKGSVYGSPTYDTPGFFEEMAIKFFDKGGALGFLRDLFITTSEMKEIVDNYRRNSEYDVSTTSSEATTISLQQNLLLEMARNEVKGMNTYKELFFTPRVSPSSNSSESAKAYASSKIINVLEIENDKTIDRELDYIFEEGITKELLDDGKMHFGGDKLCDTKVTSEATIKNDNITIVKENEGEGNYNVSAKIIKSTTSNKHDIYDIPFLRAESIIVLKEIINNVLTDIRTDKTSFDELDGHHIIVHNGTRVNEKGLWTCTGYMFTLEVKNYNNLGNILKDMSKEQDELINVSTIKTKVFDYKEDEALGKGVYKILVSPRT